MSAFFDRLKNDIAFLSTELKSRRSESGVLNLSGGDLPRLSRRAFFGLLGAVAFTSSAPCFALSVNGVDYMSIAELARACGMRYRTTDRAKSQTVFGKTTRMNFDIHSRTASINGVNAWLGFPVVEKGGMLHVARRDFSKNISPILFPQNNDWAPSPNTVIIDPGHGAKDNGAQNRRFGAKEKNIVLDIAFRLGKELKKYGYKVLYTRTNDTFVELDDRCKKANASGAGLFVSIHCNAAGSAVTGVETFSMTPRYMPSTSSAKLSKSDYTAYSGNSRDEWNRLLAYYVQRSLSMATGSFDRGAKNARYAVLRGIKMPGVLVECGFVSNNGECAKLLSSPYRQKIAESLCSAVRNYHTTLRRVSEKKK